MTPTNALEWARRLMGEGVTFLNGRYTPDSSSNYWVASPERPTR